MSDNLLTNTSDVQRRLSEAEDRFRRARNEANRLKSELRAQDRRVAAQQKICLGAALLKAVEQHPRHIDGFRRLLLPLVTRDTDRAALRGTAFDPLAAEASGAGAA